MSQTCPKGTICIDTTMMILILIGIGIVGYLGYMHYFANKQSKIIKSLKKKKVIVEEEEEDIDNKINNNPIIKDTSENNNLSNRTPQIMIAMPTVSPPTVSLPSVTTNIIQQDSVNSILRPPLRSDPNMVTVPGIPINIPTRGPTPDIQQIGILTSSDNNNILALYGRPTFRGSSKWMYYTATDKFQSIKVPVHNKNRDCTQDLGCDEIYENDEINVPSYGNTSFKATIYSLDAPRYIPFI